VISPREGPFDLAIIGAGASGLMAAATGARAGMSTAVLDLNDRPGAKLSLTGGGRCNILPADFDPGAYVTSSSRNSLAKILRRWSPSLARSFFEEAGVRPEPEEGTGKLFASSTTDGAASVVRTLVRIASDAGAVFMFRSRVIDIKPSGGRWKVRLEGGGTVDARSVMIATGGRSWPGTGSGGWGFTMAARLGHRVRQAYPALVPLRSEDAGFAGLSGIVVHAAISSRFEGRPFTVEGPLLFTHRGFSGPVTMDASHAFTGAEEAPAALLVRWGRPDASEWERTLLSGKGRILGALGEHLPSRLAALLLERAGLRPEARFAELDRPGRLSLLAVLTRFPLPVCGHCGWDEAEVTGGGVALEEVDPGSMESRLHPGLHLAGEVLDAFGPVGGWNLYWAWLTGRMAGRA